MSGQPSRREFLAAASAALPLAAASCSPPAPAPAAAPAAPAPRPAAGPPPGLDWGFPPGAVRVGLNECPLGPSPRAVEAMGRVLGQAHRYLRSTALQRALARKHGVDPSWIALGCGSTEHLQNAPRAYCGTDGEVVSARQAYRELPAAARLLGRPVHLVPLDAAQRHDLAAMAQAVTPRTRLVCVTNPNNPTGTLLPAAEIASFAKALPPEVVLVLDQAYIEFAPAADCVHLVRAHPNVLVLQTFSKIFGLAGVRVGYAVGQPKLLKPLRRLALRNHVNVVGFVGALAALEDPGHQEAYRALCASARELYTRELGALGLTSVGGATPFLVVDTRQDDDVVVGKLAGHGVFTRRGKDWGLPGWIRITVGTPEQNRQVIAALKQVLG